MSYERNAWLYGKSIVLIDQLRKGEITVDQFEDSMRTLAAPSDTYDSFIPLHYASRLACVEAVDSLLRLGFQPIRIKTGRTPLVDLVSSSCDDLEGMKQIALRLLAFDDVKKDMARSVIASLNTNYARSLDFAEWLLESYPEYVNEEWLRLSLVHLDHKPILETIDQTTDIYVNIDDNGNPIISPPEWERRSFLISRLKKMLTKE